MSTQPEREFIPAWTDGDKLRKVRRHLGMTQAEFADALQVNSITYGAWESDRNRIKDLKAIARRVKVMTGTPLWWWFDTERPTDYPGPNGGGGLPIDDSEQGSGGDHPTKRFAPVIPIRPVQPRSDEELEPTG